MRVRMAEHFGMCFGVKDAIDLALGLARQGPLTILGDLVHNPDVVAAMDAAGAARVRAAEEVRTPAVLLTAHGTADRVKLRLRGEGKEVHDATCPLVTRVHLAVRRLVEEGRQRERDPHQRERADHARRCGDADTELAGKGGDARRNDPVAERHGERHRGQDRRLARQAGERAAPRF